MLLTSETIKRVTDANLFDDQEQIQVELDYLADKDFLTDQDRTFRTELHEALELCNTELRRRGMMVDS